MCELGDKGSVASVTRYKRPRADSSHGASSMLFHHSPCQNLHWRNFTQAVRHLAWATDQQKQQNMKESRIQFLGDRKSFNIIQHISVNRNSTVVNIVLQVLHSYPFNIDCHSLNLQQGYSWVVEIASIWRAHDCLLLKLHCFGPKNNQSVRWDNKGLVVSKCATSMPCNPCTAFNSTAVLESKNKPEMIKMLKCCFSALCCRQSLDIAEFADFLFHALLAGLETKFALQENLCPPLRNAAALINANCCKTTTAP